MDDGEFANLSNLSKEEILQRIDTLRHVVQEKIKEASMVCISFPSNSKFSLILILKRRQNLDKIC